MKNQKLKGPVGFYIRLRPDAPKAGSFEVSGIINETATVEAVGSLVSDEVKQLVGKRVIFNAWACDEKTIEGEKLYYALDSANAICDILDK